MAKPKFVSFDLETLGTRATSVILSIGAVAFDEKELYQEVKINLSIDEQLRWGRTIDGSTLLFWFEQNDAARKAAIVGPVPVVKALSTFAGFLQGVPGKPTVWANGQDFDLGILGNLYDTLGVARPWAYNAGRDMRTIVDLYGSKPQVVFEGNQHDALADAKHQARLIQYIMKEMKSERKSSKEAA